MATPDRALRLILAHSDVFILVKLRAILQQAGVDVVGEAYDGRSAVALSIAVRPDIAVFDFPGPLSYVVQAARGVLGSCSNTRIVICVAAASEPIVLDCLRAGISGCLLKDVPPAALIDAIAVVSRGGIYLGPGVLTTRAAPAPPARTVAEPLSTREREVLQLLAEGRNIKEIGGMLRISSRTVETHRARIMEKLGIQTVAGLVRYAIAHGLIAVDKVSEGT